jgi:hypothetical protein
MPVAKSKVVAEIRRLAEANGSSPGVRLFERETGIRESDWFPTHWLRWSDALLEAGFAPNTMIKAASNEALLEQYALLCQRLGRIPNVGELIRESKSNPNFASEKSYRRFGGKQKLLAALAEHCRANPALQSVIAMCEAVPKRAVPQEVSIQTSAGAAGYVYLMQHGTKREYKIGKTKNSLRRAGEINIELPHGAEPIHIIETDDPSGVESYWHRRFDSKRLKGEWFALSADDVRAFRRWRKIV